MSALAKVLRLASPAAGQPRDKHGRWVDTGGDAKGAAPKQRTSKAASEVRQGDIISHERISLGQPVRVEGVAITSRPDTPNKVTIGGRKYVAMEFDGEKWRDATRPIENKTVTLNLGDGSGKVYAVKAFASTDVVRLHPPDTVINKWPATSWPRPRRGG